LFSRISEESKSNRWPIQAENGKGFIPPWISVGHQSLWYIMKRASILLLAALLATAAAVSSAASAGGVGKADQLTTTAQANRKLMQEPGLDVGDIINNETMLNGTTNGTLDGNTTSEAPSNSGPATTPPENNDRTSMSTAEPTAPIEDSSSTEAAEVPAVDCVGEWGAYDACNYVEDSHQNQQCRSYEVLTEVDADGMECPYGDGEVECITDGCSQPMDCVGEWQAYGSCVYDDADGKNKRCRTYSITSTPAYNGYECPYDESFGECDVSDCAQPNPPAGDNCVGEWGAYGNCYYNEGSHKNVRCRVYGISTDGTQNGGNGCPYPPSYEECTTAGCSQPVDCVGVWLPYELCAYDETDRQNQRCRRYRVTRASAYNGFECPQVQNAQQCAISNCAQPIACIGGWRPYGPCNDDGQRCRAYTIRREAAHGGYECPYQENFEQCVPCPQVIENGDGVGFGSASASGNVSWSEAGNTTAASVTQVLDPPDDGSSAFTYSHPWAALHSVLVASCSTILLLLL
jgi:hypothetical protein